MDDLVDISEIFPPNSKIDPELMESLPVEIRVKLNNAETLNKAKGAGKTAVSTIGINKFISKADNFSFLCNKCNVNIPLVEFDEHNDFHIALDLQKALRSETSSVILGSANKRSTEPKEKGRKRKTDQNTDKLIKSRRIDEFFHK